MRNRVLFTSVVAALAAIAAPAQGPISVTYQAATSLDVQLLSAGGPLSASLPAGTNLVGDAGRLGLSPKLGAGSNVFSSAGLHGSPTQGYDVLVHDSGVGAIGWIAESVAHETLLTFSSSQVSALALVVSIDAVTNGAGAFYQGSVDLGDDGTFDLVAAPGGVVSQVFPVTVGPAGLTLRTRSAGGTGTNTSFRREFAGNIRIELRSRRDCSAESYGLPCLAFLTGDVNLRDELELTTIGSTAGALVLEVIGIQRLALPLPGHDALSGCALRTDVLVANVFQLDSTGFAQRSMPIPPGVGSLNFQHIAVVQTPTGFVFQPSEGLTLTCQ